MRARVHTRRSDRCRIRDFIPSVLDLEAVPSDVSIPKQGPTRVSVLVEPPSRKVRQRTKRARVEELALAERVVPAAWAAAQPRVPASAWA